MAEVTRSPFDLRSWQGLTAVLKAARESSLSPEAYAAFRNLVLEYAQKGGDTDLKKKIDSIIVTFGTSDEKMASDLLESKPSAPPVKASASYDHAGGRRITPKFTAAKTVPVIETPASQSAPQVEVPPPGVSIGKEDVVLEEKKIVAVPEAQHVPADVLPTRQTPEVFRTLEEHRAHIMELKRRVNALVGNPVTLMDKGNGIGRTYMSALLTAMKATSPGSTLNVDDAMQKLEGAFNEILLFTATKNDGQVEEVIEPTPQVAKEEPREPVVPIPEPAASEPVEVSLEPQMEEDVPVVPVEAAPEQQFESENPADDVAHEHVAEMPVEEVSTRETNGDTRWSGDDQDVSKQSVREAVGAIKERNIPTRSVERGRRSFIPSLVDIEEDTPESPSTTHETAWHAHTVPDDLSTASVMRRPESPMTGITLATPQAELMSKQVTAALVQLLHEWNIFSSSGLFGMGPAGIEHPVYQQIAYLTMGEVLSSRWENASPKIAHSIKDYVDAWRHEQGIAYNPTETFEHYLRRVAQRIMKRKNGEIIVS